MRPGHAGEDKKKQEVIEARNHATASSTGRRKSLADLGDKADAAVKSDIEAKIAELRKIMEGEDAEAIKAATDAPLASHKLAEQLYQQQAQQTGGQPGGAQQEAGAHQDGNSGGNGGDDVVDDFTVKRNMKSQRACAISQRSGSAEPDGFFTLTQRNCDMPRQRWAAWPCPPCSHAPVASLGPTTRPRLTTLTSARRRPQADSGQAATGAAPRSQTRSPTAPRVRPGDRAGQGRP